LPLATDFPDKPMTARTQDHPAATIMAGERPFLRRLATLQLGSSDDADDAVQETLIAALHGWASYSGKVSVRAWLTGILRHKIIDSFRARRNHLPINDESDADINDMFVADGGWNPDTFISHQCPQAQEAQRQLLEVLELCLSHLRGETARLFLMREYLGMELHEIASAASIGEGNLRVLLHRARLRLRACVVRGWEEC
jgi:RNA polymerase sigma-70 factor (ECF subfamily)